MGFEGQIYRWACFFAKKFKLYELIPLIRGLYARFSPKSICVVYVRNIKNTRRKEIPYDNILTRHASDFLWEGLGMEMRLTLLKFEHSNSTKE